MLLMSQIAVPAFHDTPVVRFVEDGCRLRLLTFGLAFFGAVAVLMTNNASLVLPALLALNACLWPGVARAFALRSSDPHGVEMRNLLIDSALGGAWIALLQFNLLPCALLTAVLACDKALAGGWSLLLRGLVVQGAACVLMLAVHGLTFAPQTSVFEVAASLPLLIAYPLALALRLHRQVLPHGDAPPPVASDTQVPLA